MQDWNPNLYRQFEAERTRPAFDLLNRLPNFNAEQITDLGCGPGNSTELLHHAYPQAKITGLDTSALMLEQARERLPDCHFQQTDINEWQPTQPQDIIFANASLQWVPDHKKLLPSLMQRLTPEGILAIQMPDNLDQPSHRLMRQVANSAEWQDTMSHLHTARENLLTTEQYYDLLTQQGAQVDIWRTTYYHVMPSVQAIVDWLRSTGLRPFLDPLNDEQQIIYLEQYRQLLNDIYHPRADGNRLLAFPRLFIISRKVARH